MERHNILDETLSTVDEIQPEPQSVASSTTENEGILLPRRSGRIKPVRIPCECCTTGMHVRCFTSISGRRVIHTTRQPRTPRTRDPRYIRKTRSMTNASRGTINVQNDENTTADPPEINQIPTRNFEDIFIMTFGPNFGRRPIFGLKIIPTKRKFEECEEIPVTRGDPQDSRTPDNYPNPSKRARIGNLPTELVLPQNGGITEKENEKLNEIPQSLRAVETIERMSVGGQISPASEDLSMEQNIPQAVQSGGFSNVQNIPQTIQSGDFSMEQNIPQAIQSGDFSNEQNIPQAILSGAFSMEQNIPQAIQSGDFSNEQNIPQTIQSGDFSMEQNITQAIQSGDFSNEQNIPQAIQSGDFSMEQNIPQAIQSRDFSNEQNISQAIQSGDFSMEQNIPQAIQTGDFSNEQNISQAIQSGDFSMEQNISQAIPSGDFTMEENIPQAIQSGDFTMEENIPQAMQTEDFSMEQNIPQAIQSGDFSMEQNIPQSSHNFTIFIEVKKEAVKEQSVPIEVLKMEENVSETAGEAETIELLAVESMECDEVPVETSLQTHVESPLENSVTIIYNNDENGSQHLPNLEQSTDEHNMISPPEEYVMEMPEDLIVQPTEESRQLIAIVEGNTLTHFKIEQNEEEPENLQGDTEQQNNREVEQQGVNRDMSEECADDKKSARRRCSFM